MLFRSDGRIRYTKKGDTAYAIVLPEENAELPPAKLQLNGVHPADGSTVELLGGTDAVEWVGTDTGAEIVMPQVPTPGGRAWVVKVRV